MVFLSIFYADSLYAAAPTKSQLPLMLDHDWTLCINIGQSKIDCQQQSTLAAIEQTFNNYDGEALYHTRFQLDDSLVNTTLSLYIPHLRDADKVFLNGQQIGQSGQFPPNFQKATLYSRSYSLPNNILHYGADQENKIVVRVFNHVRQGGFSGKAPIIDTTKNIRLLELEEESLLMLFIGIMIIIATVQLFYFAAQTESKDHLYFGLFCIAEALYILSYSQFIQTTEIEFNTIFRFNIALFGILTLLFFLFMTCFFKYHAHRWFYWSLIGLLVSLSIIPLLIPIDHIYSVVYLLQILSAFVLAPFYLYLFYRAIKENLAYTKLMAWTLGLFIIAVIVDFLVDLQVIPPVMGKFQGLLSPLFLIGIFIVLTLILIHKHWRYYQDATYDFLTNSLRRSAFTERLNEELQRIHRNNSTLVLALLDLDDFKQINDKYNHIVGDTILRTVARRAHRELREFDLLGRYGGDEFILAAQVSDQHDAFQFLKRVHSSITETPIMTNDKLEITISITIGGVSTTTGYTKSAEELIEEADEILVQGKIKQKGRVHI